MRDTTRLRSEIASYWPRQKMTERQACVWLEQLAQHGTDDIIASIGCVAAADPDAQKITFARLMDTLAAQRRQKIANTSAPDARAWIRAWWRSWGPEHEWQPWAREVYSDATGSDLEQWHEAWLDLEVVTSQWRRPWFRPVRAEHMTDHEWIAHQERVARINTARINLTVQLAVRFARLMTFGPATRELRERVLRDCRTVCESRDVNMDGAMSDARAASEEWLRDHGLRVYSDEPVQTPFASVVQSEQVDTVDELMF